MKKLLVGLLLFSSFIQAQSNADSLLTVWNDSSLSDSIRVEALQTHLFKGLLFSQPDSAAILARELTDFSRDSRYLKGVVKGLNLQGIAHAIQGQYDEAIAKYEQGIKLADSIDEPRMVSSMRGNLGGIYYNQGDFFHALEIHQKSLNTHQEKNDTLGMANSLNSLSGIYYHLGDMEKALNSYRRSHDHFQQINNINGVALSKLNIGLILLEQGQVDSALVLFDQGLEMNKEIGNRLMEMSAHEYMAAAYDLKGDSAKVYEYYEQALLISQEMNSKKNNASILISLGRLELGKNNLTQAKQHAADAEKLCLEIEVLKESSELYLLLSQIAEKEGRNADALTFYKSHISYLDSLKSDDVKKQIAQTESRAQFEKEQLIKEQEQQEAARLNAEAKSRRDTLQYSGIGVGLLSLFGLTFLLGRVHLPAWSLELAVFLPILILFEFLLVVTDPWVDQISNGEPLIKLGVNVLLAGMIFPLHSLFERVLKRYLGQ
ncbi:tetratricopeptide repeat protein [bacterium SCSIO 12741]|nr:tetratricopeptide repeat protein [bacterium SCSIO 12741]